MRKFRDANIRGEINGAFTRFILVVTSLVCFSLLSQVFHSSVLSFETSSKKSSLPSLEEIDRVLSGEDSVCIDSSCTIIHTRYAYSNEIKIARSYIVALIEDRLGLEALVQRFPLKIEKPQFTTLVASPGGDTLWLGDMQGDLYFLLPDGQKTICDLSTIDGEIYDLTVDSRGYLWAACGLKGGGLGGLFVSADGGVSWSMAASGSEIYSLSSVAFGNEIFGMAGGSYGTVLQTANGGKSWNQLDPANFNYHSIMDISSLGPTKFMLVGYFGDLFKTDDLGISWETEHFSDFPLYAIDFYGERYGILVGTDVVYYTRDSGATWTHVQVAADLRGIAMRDSSTAVAVGSDGEIWMSEDGGSSWVRMSDACTAGEDIVDVVAIGESFWMCGENLVRRLGTADQQVECDKFAVSDTIWGENISFEHSGEIAPDSVIVVCGHYDSISKINPFMCAPGADDNGSGVISVLHVADAISDIRLRKSVEFELFDGEEVGLRGSRYFASHLDSTRNYICAINIDMIGYNADGKNTLTIVGREGVEEDSLLADEFRRAVESLDVDIVCDPFPGAPYASDHYSFWDEGIPSVLLIEGRKDDTNGWTPYYHTCNDKYDTVDFAFVGDCVDLVAEVVKNLACVIGGPEEQVSKPILYRNSPNPFCDKTSIEYVVPSFSYVELAVYDVSGRRLCVIDRGYREAQRRYFVDWDGTAGGEPLPSGVYFLRLRMEGAESSRKLVIVR